MRDYPQLSLEHQHQVQSLKQSMSYRHAQLAFSILLMVLARFLTLWKVEVIQYPIISFPRQPSLDLNFLLRLGFLKSNAVYA